MNADDVLKAMRKAKLRDVLVVGIDQDSRLVMRSTMGQYQTRDLAEMVAMGLCDRETVERVDDAIRRSMN